MTSVKGRITAARGMDGLVGENDTVDGSFEILPLPVEGSENHIIYRVLVPSKRWLALGFLNHLASS